MSGWVGFDLDGTLAHYDKWRGPQHIGEPVEPMVLRLRAYLTAGVEVRIVTARVSHDGTADRRLSAAIAYQAITEWLVEHIGEPLVITNAKDYGMIYCYDDRARAVEKNTGKVLSWPTAAQEKSE